jgi:serine/threonine protein kinase
LKVIGRGAFGKVLLVKLTEESKIYAMKCIMKKSLVKHKKEIEHTLAERAVMMKLNHPFLMKLYYTYQTDDKLFYIMDYVNGGELFFHLEKEGHFSLERTRFYIAELLLALEYLHENGVVYRDIKTENILLGSDGHIVLTDFGLSKELSTSARTSTLCGTPVYLPPEMLLKQEYGKAVDFWSLGILLFEMLVGDVPFYHDNVQKMFRKIVQEDVVIPPEFEGTTAANLIHLLLKKNPLERLTDFNEVKKQPFFSEINWESLYRKELNPPYVPTVQGIDDTSNFDREIINEAVELDDDGNELSPEEQKIFLDINFNYVSPMIGDDGV